MLIIYIAVAFMAISAIFKLKRTSEKLNGHRSNKTSQSKNSTRTIRVGNTVFKQ